ncbi:MAG: LysR family transcriptional regulator substrate-binding protein, partial [Planctomycetota bacterium]|nr:LysR family transcriptional regulator substrate-binding protein [Planctomycetota bacterium]
TPAGERLLEFVIPFFRDLPRVVEGVRTGNYDGALTIQAESLLIRQLLPPWLVALRKRRPQAQLTLQELVTVDLSALRSGAADVVIAHLSDVPDDIASQQIATVHACLVVPKASAPQRGRPKLRDLASMPFLSYEPGTRHHALQLQAIAQHGVTLTSTIALGTADAILGYVESGLGWSLVPSLDRDGPKGRRLAAYPWGEPRVTFPIVMAWRKDAPEHPALDEMIACAPQP